MSPDNFCQAQVELLGQTLFCDRFEGHDGLHGGVWPGFPGKEDRRTIDVQVQW